MTDAYVRGQLLIEPLELEELFIASYRALLALSVGAGFVIAVSAFGVPQQLFALLALLAFGGIVATGRQRRVWRSLAAVAGRGAAVIWVATAVTVTGDELSYVVPVGMAVGAILGARHLAGPGAWPSFALLPPTGDVRAPIGTDVGWIEEDGRIING